MADKKIVGPVTRPAQAAAPTDEAQWTLAWDQTLAELEQINRAFCDAHETPSKEHTPEQKEHLKALRAQATAIGYERFLLLTSKARPRT